MHLKLKTIINLLVILILTQATASASTFSQSFLNDYQSDAIYLFIVNDNAGRDINFVTDPVVFGGAASGWTTTLFDSESLVMQGSRIDPQAGQFDVTFWDNRTRGRGNPTGFFDFTLEWAEYLDGAMAAQGSIYYTDGIITSADDNFTSTVPTPVPASVWMLFSGLAFVIGIRRNSKKG